VLVGSPHEIADRLVHYRETLANFYVSASIYT